MAQNLDPLIRDLVEWVAREPRTYAEVMEAWRTSCPRLTVWEDALEAGLLVRTFDPVHGAMVAVTDAGRRTLAQASHERRAKALTPARAPSAGSDPAPTR